MTTDKIISLVNEPISIQHTRKNPVHLHVFPKDISGDVNKVAPFSLMSDIDAIGCLYHISYLLSAIISLNTYQTLIRGLQNTERLMIYT